MLEDGYFDAYNQWLLGKAENAQQFEAWNSFHQGVISDMEKWIEQYPYRPSARDFYHDKKFKGLFSGRKN
jgi:hypothetical protein